MRADGAAPSAVIAQPYGARETMQLSLIICTHNRRDSLGLTLETLREQRCSVPWELIVVDNDCSDGTAELLARLVGDFPVPFRTVTEKERGLARARNAGAAAATGDYVIFTDDDVNCLPGFVAAHAEMLARPDVDGASGRIVPILPDEISESMRAMLTANPGGPAGGYDMGDAPAAIDLTDEPPPLPFGANMSIGREWVDRLGGFRPDLGIGKRLIQGEETDLFERAIGRGARIVYQPTAVVEHRVQADHVTFEYYLRWWEGRGRSIVLSRDLRGIERVITLLREVIRYVGDSMRVWSRRGRGIERIEACAKRATTVGRLAQLVGR
jgi:glycosyltransferase involved in cell wall biosynthesis